MATTETENSRAETIRLYFNPKRIFFSILTPVIFCTAELKRMYGEITFEYKIQTYGLVSKSILLLL